MTANRYALLVVALVVVCAGCADLMKQAEEAELVTKVTTPGGDEVWALTDKGREKLKAVSETGGGLLSGLTGVNLSPVIESLLLLALGAAGVKPSAAAVARLKNGKKPVPKK